MRVGGRYVVISRCYRRSEDLYNDSVTYITSDCYFQLRSEHVLNVRHEAYIREEHFVFTDRHHCFDDGQSLSLTKSQEAHYPTIDVGGEDMTLYSTSRSDAQRGNSVRLVYTV